MHLSTIIKIIIGNIIMDGAIGLFAVLLGFETRIHRRATLLEQEGQLRQFAEDHNQGIERRGGPRPLTDEEIEAGAMRNQADRISPINERKPYYFLSLFVVGIVLQTIGVLISDNMSINLEVSNSMNLLTIVGLSITILGTIFVGLIAKGGISRRGETISVGKYRIALLGWALIIIGFIITLISEIILISIDF